MALEEHPGALVRGPLHSDGCRAINRVRGRDKTYEYPRYFFSNRSEDIRGLFTSACDALGIPWRQNNPYSISVARRPSVELLDRIVGPKY